MSLREEERYGTAAEHTPVEPRLIVNVVFTSLAGTLAALKAASGLANQLGARIGLLVPQVVPYPCPLSAPPVLVDFNERRFREIASASSVETAVQVYLCRDNWEILRKVLKPNSLIVLGGRRRWWPTKDKRLAGKLRRAGHTVVFVEKE